MAQYIDDLKMVETVATIAGNVKKPWSKAGMIALSSVLLAGAFTAVFFYRNNISVSFDAFSSNDKYRAEAFVKKRQGLKSKSKGGSLSGSGNSARAGFSAKIDFDAKSNKARLIIRDKNGNPVSRINVTGRITRAGNSQQTREFKMKEFGKGDFRSAPLELGDGGWVLTVSAYDPYTLNKDKLVFYTERPVYVARK